MKNLNYIFVLKLVVAIILLQTLYFKFTAHHDSVYIFSKLGIEPFGRIGSGVVELFAALLLFVNKTKWYASFAAMSTMLIAVLSHLFVLGIEVHNDGGTLFTLAIITFVCSTFLVFKFRIDISLFKK